jgi:hypothetical protein
MDGYAARIEGAAVAALAIKAAMVTILVYCMVMVGWFFF